MKRMLAVVSMLALAVTSTVGAQGTAPGSNAGAPSTTPAPAQPTAPPQASPPATSDADARLCLEFPTNHQIIVCAEKYLPRKLRGQSS